MQEKKKLSIRKYADWYNTQKGSIENEIAQRIRLKLFDSTLKTRMNIEKMKS